MNNREFPGHPEDYSEKQLVHDLQNLTHDLMPNSGDYTLEISGIKLGPQSQAVLEAHSGITLNNSEGFTIQASFDRFLENLHIDSISGQTSGSVDVHIIKTPHGYFPIKIASDTGKELARQDFLVIAPEIVEGIQQEIGIDTPPTNSVGAYRLWLSNLVSQHGDWAVQESMRLCEGMLNEDAHYSVTISKSQMIQKNEKQELASLRYTTSQLRETGDADVVDEEVVAWTDFTHPTKTAVTLQRYREQIDPFVVDHTTPRGVMTSRSDHQARRFELDDERIIRFKKLIDIAQDERDRLEHLPNN